MESALWSLLLSLAICVAAVSVFTAHPLLLLPVLITILGKRLYIHVRTSLEIDFKSDYPARVGVVCVMMSFWPPPGVICLVVAVMYWLGWEMGAVEAISLSILVGSSVDYCLHLVEGYLLAGETMPSTPGHNSVWESEFVSQQLAVRKTSTACLPFTHMLKQANE